MSESREEKLAKLLVNYSVNLKEGEVCLINAVDVPCSMVEKLIKAVVDAKAIPLLNQSTIRAERALIEYSSSESLKLWADIDAYRMAKVDAFIGIRPSKRENEQFKNSTQTMPTFITHLHHDIRVPKTKWVVLRYPTQLMAYQANMGAKNLKTIFGE